MEKARLRKMKEHSSNQMSKNLTFPEKRSIKQNASLLCVRVYDTVAKESTKWTKLIPLQQTGLRLNVADLRFPELLP